MVFDHQCFCAVTKVALNSHTCDRDRHFENPPVLSHAIDIAYQQEQAEPAQQDRVRSPVVLLSFAALAGSCVLATYLEFKTHSAHLAMSNLPLVVLIPFVVGLTINVLLKRFIPAYSLTSAELRILLSVLWVGGSFAGYNWATQWVGTMAAPRYYASPENRWMELIFDYLPWWMYPTNLEGVEEQFYLGAHQQAFPWTAWIGPTFWACAAGVAMTSIAIGVTALFQRHWADHERLTYPLAEVPLALTDGFNQQRGWAPFTRERLFWIGFGVAAFPVLWNIIEYFVTGFPRISIFDPYYSQDGVRAIFWTRHVREFSYRLLPTVMGFTFLCDVNLLFSLWSLYLVGLMAQYGMSRVGFSIGLAGQEAKPPEIAGLFSHGVMMGLFVWSLWTARPHLRHIWRQARLGQSEDTVFLSPRGALVSIVVGGLFMTFWLHAAGFELWLACAWIVLFWISLFVVMKFLAASGFGYIFPKWGGTTIPTIWTGTTGLSESSFVATGVVNWRLLAGWRLPPSLPHVERMIGQRNTVTRLIVVATLTGLVAGACYTIQLCYREGGATFNTWSLVGAPRGMYNSIAKVVAETDRTIPDPGKISVWLLGIGASGIITVLQARVSWWPWHPIGLLMMFDGSVRVHTIGIFIVWLTKVMILRLGGIGLYRRAKPCCYGLIVGFVFAIACACTVDLIWFPSTGHYVHGY